MKKLFKLKFSDLFSDTNNIKNLSELTDYDNIISEFGDCFYNVLTPSESDLEIVKETKKKFNSKQEAFNHIIDKKKNCLRDIMYENFADDIKKKILEGSDILDDFFKEVDVMIGNDKFCYEMDDSLLYIGYEDPYKVTNFINTNKGKVKEKISSDDIDTLFFTFSLRNFRQIVENKYKESWKKISKSKFNAYINSQLEKLKNNIDIRDILEGYVMEMEDEWEDYVL